MLEVDGISCAFGALRALDGVSLTLEEGELLGLIGPNGSGKSTLFNVITGLYVPTAGAVRFAGRSLSGQPIHAATAAGIARTFQTPRLYERMTVLENVEAARLASASGSHRLSERDRDDLTELLNLVGIADRKDEIATELSLPDRRRLELVRTQAANPRLVLLDEPAGGMTPSETEEMGRLIRGLIKSGQSCIVIEHKMDLIRQLCPRTVVLNFGHKIADGPTAQVLSEKDVLEAYLGMDEAGSRC